jgi:hypothetical protein
MTAALALAYANEMYDILRRLEAVRDSGEEPVKSDMILRSRLSVAVRDVSDLIDRFEDHSKGWAE